MSEYTKPRTVEETALASQKFLNAITEKANELDIGRGLAVSLFGLYAKRIIELDIADGASKDFAVERAVGAFMQGMGFVRQDIEPPNTPLQ